MPFEREDRIALSAAGIAAGYLLASWGVKKAGEPLVSYYNNDLRDQVNSSCGVELTNDQWVELLKTDEWMKFRTSLPLLPWSQRARRLILPTLLFSSGSLAIGASADLLLSAFYDLDGVSGLLTFAASSAAILYGRLVFFKQASEGLVNPGNIHPYSNICVAARDIASRGQPVVAGAQSPPQQLPLFDKKGRPVSTRAMRIADGPRRAVMNMPVPLNGGAGVATMPPFWFMWRPLPFYLRLWM